MIEGAQKFNQLIFKFFEIRSFMHRHLSLQDEDRFSPAELSYRQF
jgi:hypothetical protein